MILRKLITSAVALSATAAILAPTLALAQAEPPPPPPPPPPAGAYDTQGGYAYDGCHRESANRGIAGTLIGGLLGAAAGSNIAARGHRTDGSVVGGVVGAVIGNHVGRDSAACYDRYGDDGYRGGYRTHYSYGYAERGPPPGYYHRGYAYERGYEDGRYADDRGYQGGAPDGCRLAESPVYMPNGEVQRRYVRVCPDAEGRYQVVD